MADFPDYSQITHWPSIYLKMEIHPCARFFKLPPAVCFTDSFCFSISANVYDEPFFLRSSQQSNYRPFRRPIITGSTCCIYRQWSSYRILLYASFLFWPFDVYSVLCIDTNVNCFRRLCYSILNLAIITLNVHLCRSSKNIDSIIGNDYWTCIRCNISRGRR